MTEDTGFSFTPEVPDTSAEPEPETPADPEPAEDTPAAEEPAEDASAAPEAPAEPAPEAPSTLPFIPAEGVQGWLRDALEEFDRRFRALGG